MDTRDLPPVPEETSAAPTKEMVLIFNLADVLAPSLIAVGLQRVEEFYFLRGQDSVEFSRDKEGSWWVIILIDNKLRSESIVDGITQALRLLWTFGIITVVEGVPADVAT